MLKNITKEKVAACAVHGFTGSGAVLGFLAIIFFRTLLIQ